MKIQAIPTNIITGFLGVGKTTAILHLLAKKPADERWAVLVNEFGEIGIDGALLKTSGVEIREVPGGCMCCVAGLPMQIGLNRLIASAKPDRILIEPTGLGHPAQIVQMLLAPPYQNLLHLGASITLIDPRKLQDTRYRDNENFAAQAALADVLVANKIELASDEDLNNFSQYAQQFVPKKTIIAQVSQAQLHLEWLDVPRQSRTISASESHRQSAANALQNTFIQLPQPAVGELWLRRENRYQEFYSCGWVFVPGVIFSMEKLFIWLSGLYCRRVKGVMITAETVMAFNAENGVLSVSELPESDDSRIEIIHDQPLDWDEIESILLNCRLGRAAQAVMPNPKL